MKTIQLSQGKVAMVDDDDYSLVMQYKWYARLHRYTWYAQTATPGNLNRKMGLHNLILGCKGVDHKDGDGLNNQRANLRPCTVGQNNSNNRLRKDSSTGFKGVTRESGASPSWRARIRKNGKYVSVGSFGTAEQAAHAYDAAAKAQYGEFARLNFPLIRDTENRIRNEP
jgi:hypothetical protein